MNFRQLFSVIRAFSRSIIVTLVIIVGAASAFTLLSTPTYRSSFRLFVTTPGTLDSNNAYSSSLFSVGRVKSYTDLITSEPVMRAVISDLDLKTTTKQLATQITAAAPLDTVLIEASVSSKSALLSRTIADSLSKEFTKYINQLEQPSTSQAAAVNISVAEPASLPTSPASPRKKLNLALGILLGLAAGIGQAVLRATLDTSVKGPNDVDPEIEAPVIGMIPFDPEADQVPLPMESAQYSSRSEAYRQVRTNLQYIDIDNPPKSIVVTSSLPREGKTTSVANLAMAMAQSGLRVVVVEADLRRPRMRAYFDVPQQTSGLTDILIGHAMLSNTLVRDVSPGVDFIPSGPTPPNPSELLASSAMVRLLRSLESSYDVVLLDTPPVLPVTDAVVLATSADGVLLLVDARSTKNEQLVTSYFALRAVDAHVIGIVLNRVAFTKLGSYGYASEGYAPTRRSRRERSLPVDVPESTDLPARELSDANERLSRVRHEHPAHRGSRVREVELTSANLRDSVLAAFDRATPKGPKHGSESVDQARVPGVADGEAGSAKN